MSRLLVLLFAAAIGLGAQAGEADFQPRGEGTLRWFGLKIYDARLLAPPDFRAQTFSKHPFMLELTYARRLYGHLIAARSVDEIKKQGLGTPQQHEQWLESMKAVFPDVGANDRLTGIYTPGQGARFLFNGAPIKSIDDPEFSKAFFSIWLSPKTSEPALRSALIGPADAPRK